MLRNLYIWIRGILTFKNCKSSCCSSEIINIDEHQEYNNVYI